MIVRCDVQDCKHWSEDGGSFKHEGGCTLDMITISDKDIMYSENPACEDYEERS